MGLDITAYSKMKRIECESVYPCEIDGHVQPYINPDFPEAAIGITGCYRELPGSKEWDFRAGSYSGYNWWRDELCQMVHGIPDSEFVKNPKGAFAELIWFSDCEGTIGPLTSLSLAKDFACHQPLADARRDDGTMFWDKYNQWRAAFETAADGGFVRFH